MIAFVVDLAFCLSLGGLLAMHARMVWLNFTTIEMFEKQRATQWPYDRGPRRNFEEVFGSRWVAILCSMILLANSDVKVSNRESMLYTMSKSQARCSSYEVADGVEQVLAVLASNVHCGGEGADVGRST